MVPSSTLTTHFRKCFEGHEHAAEISKKVNMKIHPVVWKKKKMHRMDGPKNNAAYGLKIQPGLQYICFLFSSQTTMNLRHSGAFRHETTQYGFNKLEKSKQCCRDTICGL
jgi:hypothetical protein